MTEHADSALSADEPVNSAAADAPRPEGCGPETPLLSLVWDSPNMDATLYNVCDGHPPVRPDLNALGRWLSSIAEPGAAVEGTLFTAVAEGRGAQVAPWVTAIRSAGMNAFVKPRASGDIDEDLTAFVNSRLTTQRAPGHLVLATHDQALSRPLAERASELGWKVTFLGYVEHAAWVERDGWEFLDIEDLPGLFTVPLGRLNLDRLPPEGLLLLATAPLGGFRRQTRHDAGEDTEQPESGPLGSETGLLDELLGVIAEVSRTSPDGKVALAPLGNHARNSIRDYSERLGNRRLSSVLETAVDDGRLELGDAGTPVVWVRLVGSSSPTSIMDTCGDADDGRAQVASVET